MRYDLLLVGGGLANGLIAYRLAARRPELRILLLEAGPSLGGEHTWSFHESDLDPGQAAWLDPFVVHRWPAYDVIFPGLRRRVGTGYRSVTSGRFHQVLAAALGEGVRFGVRVEHTEPQGIVLDGGEEIAANALIDGRGFALSPHLTLAWQKFLGLELRFARPHGLTAPIVMDAAVDQRDGFRFVYVLPFGPDRALVEDTYYSDDTSLDDDALRQRIGDYVAARGWTVAAVLREERGVLPITLGGDARASWSGATVPRAGLRAGLYHPTTGFSLPDAVRLADHICGLRDLSSAGLLAAVRDWSLQRWKEQGFFRLLNRMLFRAGDPSERWRVLRRFYGLPELAIRRFYAGRLVPADKARLLCGKPPVPLLGAVRAALDLPKAAA